MEALKNRNTSSEFMKTLPNFPDRAQTTHIFLLIKEHFTSNGVQYREEPRCCIGAYEKILAWNSVYSDC